MNAQRGEREAWKEAIRWFDKADEDVEAARALLAASSRLLYPAALHCQQAAEKYAKGVLVARGITPPHIHSIARLADLVQPVAPDIGHPLEQMGGWTAWFVYPNEYADPGVNDDDVASALESLGHLRERIYRLAPESDA